MDLAIGARQVFVMMDLFTRDGACKIVRELTYPVTGLGCVARVYTDRAVLEIAPGAPRVLETFGCTLDELRAATGLDLAAP